MPAANANKAFYVGQVGYGPQATLGVFKTKQEAQNKAIAQVNSSKTAFVIYEAILLVEPQYAPVKETEL